MEQRKAEERIYENGGQDTYSRIINGGYSCRFLVLIVLFRRSRSKVELDCQNVEILCNSSIACGMVSKSKAARYALPTFIFRYL